MACILSPLCGAAPLRFLTPLHEAITLDDSKQAAIAALCVRRAPIARAGPAVMKGSFFWAKAHIQPRRRRRQDARVSDRA